MLVQNAWAASCDCTMAILTLSHGVTLGMWEWCSGKESAAQCLTADICATRPATVFFLFSFFFKQFFYFFHYIFLLSCDSGTYCSQLRSLKLKSWMLLYFLFISQLCAEIWISGLEKRRLRGISSMSINTWREGAKRSKPGSFQQLLWSWHWAQQFPLPVRQHCCVVRCRSPGKGCPEAVGYPPWSCPWGWALLCRALLGQRDPSWL